MQEIEIKYLDINPQDLEERLLVLGAIKVSDELFEEWLYAKPEWKDRHGRVRIRKEGEKTTLAYKETTQATNKGNLEIEFAVSDADAARMFVEKLGLTDPRHQQKRRIHFSYDSVTIDIDFWPLLPPMVEIEGANISELEEIAGKLGLDIAKRCDLDAMQIYQQIYNIDIENRRELVF